ncbi:MAG: hypothetical protein IJU83_02900, partial [Clostridia bacterium]|nr:hypothetical protein [Clostridia bacterium]
MKMEKENNDFTAEEKAIRKNNRKALLSVGLALVITASFFLGFFVYGATEPASGRKISEIVRIIDGASVYADGKNADELAELFRKIVLADDAYAKYYTAEEYRKMLAEDAGNYSGVGIAIDENGVIKYVYRNSPAHRGGIKAGDKLTEGIFVGEEEYKVFTDALNEYNADKEDKDKKIIQQIYTEFFSGYNVGETVRFKVDRTGEEKEFSIVKEDYVVSYVEYADNEKSYYFSTEEDGFRGRESDENFIEGLSADTAYIKLYEFQGGAAAQ